MTGSAYTLRDACFRVGTAALLQDICLDIHYGRVLALVGPNGAGKSTLLSLLTGEARASAGTVLLDGQPIARYRARELARMRSVLTQSNQVSFAYTVHDVVAMGRNPWINLGQDADAGPAADDAAIRAALQLTDVSHLTARVFSSLSGGERTRVSLARVLAQDTPIVMLDEPTSALDLRHQEEVLRVARDLAARGRAVVVVLHDLSLAAAYADEVAIINEGRLVGSGTPVEMLTADQIERVYQTPVHVLPDPDTGRPMVLPKRQLGAKLSLLG